MNICVYGASSDDISRSFIEAGEALGREMARRNIGLVFGGGATGMMGAVARGITECGGHIIGVAPRFFNADGILYDKCDEMIRTDTMRQRKQTMEDRSDAFIMTPGGIGTLEEFFEILTLKQLGQLAEPIAVLNTDGYFDDMQSMIDTAVKKEFVSANVTDLYAYFTDVNEMLDYIRDYKPVKVNPSVYRSVLRNV